MTSEKTDKTFSKKAREAISDFSADAQAAAQRAAKQVERTKLSSLTLPQAYSIVARNAQLRAVQMIYD